VRGVRLPGSERYLSSGITFCFLLLQRSEIFRSHLSICTKYSPILTIYVDLNGTVDFRGTNTLLFWNRMPPAFSYNDEGACPHLADHAQ
jgi:hypothetical protein